MPWINARYAGQCAECREDIEEGDRVLFEPDERKTLCEVCGLDTLDPEE